MRGSQKFWSGVGLALAVLIWFGTWVYIEREGFTVPQNEQWNITMDVVLAAQDGTLGLQDLWVWNDIHNVFLPMMFSAVSSTLTDWNLLYEVRIGFVFLTLTLLLVADGVRRENSDIWLYVLPVLTLFLLALRQRSNLIWGFTAIQWFMSGFWAVLVIWVFAMMRTGWLSLALQIVFATLSIFSSFSAIVLLPLWLLFFWIKGYRWQHGVVWLAFFAAVMGMVVPLYVGNSGGELGSESLWNHATFFMSLMSGVFAPNPSPMAYQLYSVFFILGFGLWLFLLLDILRTRQWQSVTFFLMLNFYGLGGALLTTLGRTLLINWGGAQSRLLTLTLYFWVGLIAIAFHYLWRNRQHWSRVPVALVVLILVGGVVRSNWGMWTLPRHQGVYGVGISTQDEMEQCYWAYQASGGEACVTLFHGRGAGNLFERIDILFERGLTVYADYDGYNRAQMRLPQLFMSESDKLIISAPAPQQHVAHITHYDFYADGDVQLSAGQVLRVMTATDDIAPELQSTVAHVLTGQETDIDQLEAFLRMNTRVWYVRGADVATHDTLIFDWLLDHYTMTVIQGGGWNTTVYEDVFLFQRKPQTLYQFGDAVSLQDWRMTSDYQQTACGDITLDMLWYAEQDGAEQYSLALVLIDANGALVARSDDAPGGYTTTLWQQDNFYFAQDRLPFCDLESGSYALLMSLSPSGETDALTVTNANGDVLESLIYLTNIEVQ